MRLGLYFGFWGLCAKDAFKGSFVLANAWSGLWGPFLIWALFYWQGKTLPLPANLDSYALLLVLAFLAATWLGLLIVRFIGSPARLYASLKATIPPIPKSDIAVRLHDKMAYCMAFKCANGTTLPPARAWLAEVTNIGSQHLQRCQILFERQAVTGQFELRPSETKEFPILFLRDQMGERPIAYFMDHESNTYSGEGGWLPHPGIYDVTVLSANTSASLIQVTLSTQKEQPFVWDLLPCA